MSKVIEKKLLHCNRCNKITTHKRNNTNMGLVWFLVHLLLTLITAGVWLVLLIIYKILTFKVGGWKCPSCIDSRVSVSLYERLNNIKLW